MNTVKTGLLLSVLAISGCSIMTERSFHVVKEPVTPSEYVNLHADLQYPMVATDFMEIKSGSQMLLTANSLADKLGVEFVEWHYSLNPYEFSHLRNLLVDINYWDPQASFLALFSRTGLLPFYDAKQNTVFVHPHSMGESLVNQATVFTPLFEQAQQEVEIARQREKERLAKDWHKYFYYEGYSIKSTVNAWAKHAGMSSVVWFVQDLHQKRFLDSKLTKNDFQVGLLPEDAIESLVQSELTRQKKPFLLSVTREHATNRLIIHPYLPTENVVSFDIEPTSVRANLSRMAEQYGYELEYLATDYRVPTPYVTVIGDYLEKAFKVVIDGYPLDLEVIESTKILKVRDQ
ncbi:hypothetical protein [Vibrio mediterranei]|uniref:hypothetical protein n=1 Tax=Vibrio mediterranei TaxID=689 RepID=UPI0040684E8B